MFNAETDNPQDICQYCRGAGYVHPLAADGKPDYGRVVVCRCAKKDRDRDRFERLKQYSNLGALTHLTFENLEADGRSGDRENQNKFNEAYKAAKEFAVNPKGWLVLSGPPGSGKTHLATAIVNKRITDGLPAFFMTVADLLDHLRSAFNPNSEMTYDELFEKIRNAPLLVLDDLGMHYGTPWAKEKLDQLLNYRFNSSLPTVITLNVAVDELEENLRYRFGEKKLCNVLALAEKSDASLELEWSPEFKLQKSMTFENFDWRRMNLPEEQRENLEKAFRLALDFAKSPEGWLVFNGVTGCGKTHLAAAIINHRYQAHQPALFTVVADFLDHLRSAFGPDSKLSYDQVFEKVKKAPFLVLDDFGEQSTTPWAREKLYQVINYRYNARLSTVVTTRFSMDEILEQVESSIGSRLSDIKISTVWNITAPDYRTDATSAKKTAPRRNSTKRWS